MKSHTFFIIIISLLLLTSCDGGRTGLGYTPDQDYYQGTEGLVMSFIGDAPPIATYEGQSFDVQVLIENKGAFDVIQTQAATLAITYDTSAVQLMADYNTNAQFYNDLSTIQLHGKSYFYPSGENNFFGIARYAAKPISGNFETSDVDFHLQLCYPYRTSFSQEVCIDTDIDGTNLRARVCEASDYEYSNGQGAPIAVVGLETRMVPKGVYVEPQFTFYLENVGGGVVSDYVLEGNNNVVRCGQPNIDTVNMVSVQAFLLGEELTCTPQKAYLREGAGEVTCYFADGEIIQATSNFATALSANISYFSGFFCNKTSWIS